MKQRLFALGMALLSCVGLCVPALAAPEGDAGVLPVTPTFIYSSGARAWATELTIHTDGTFEGSFHDGFMGDIGDGYPNGTVYINTFHGDLDHITQVDPYTWSMKLASMDTEETPGSEWIEDGILYIADEARGMPDIGGEVLLYLPGHDRASLPESFLEDTMFTGSGNDDAAQIDFFGLFNVEDESGFGSSLEDSQTAQAIQERIDAGEPQRLLELAAYHGDISVCKMSAGQARAFAQVIEDQAARLYQDRTEHGYWYERYIASYAALFDLGNGVPALFFAGGETTYDKEREDGCFWSDVGTFGIWLYEDGKAVEYEPPHSGLTLALFPSALFVGGYQGSDHSVYDGRVYPVRDGAIASDPDLTAQAYYEDGTYFLNGAETGEAEFKSAVEKWGEDLALAGHSYGGGVEGNIWGMCQTEKMLTVLGAYAGMVNETDMSVPSQPPEDASTPEQPDASAPDVPAPERDGEPDQGSSIMPAAGIAAATAAAIAVIAVLIRKKKTADAAPAGSVPPSQSRTPEPPQTDRGTQSPGPRKEFNFCPQCGSKVQAGDHFCAKCGHPLN